MREKSNTWIYVTLIVVIVALMAVGAARYHNQKQTREAQAKAQEFIARLHDAGLAAPSEATAVRLFGTDGGPFVTNPDGSLAQAEWAWAQGTPGAASRPLILDPDFVKAASIFVSVYAPEKAAKFQAWVDGLKTGETQ